MKVYSNLPDIIVNKNITFIRSNISLQQAKQEKIKYRVVHVLHKNLRHKLDLHNKPYKPLQYIYIQSGNEYK